MPLTTPSSATHRRVLLAVLRRLPRNWSRAGPIERMRLPRRRGPLADRPRPGRHVALFLLLTSQRRVWLWTAVPRTRSMGSPGDFCPPSRPAHGGGPASGGRDVLESYGTSSGPDRRQRSAPEIRKVKAAARRSVGADVAALTVTDTPQRLAALAAAAGDVRYVGRRPSWRTAGTGPTATPASVAVILTDSE